MNTLRGNGHGRSPVYARAAHLDSASGRPTLDADLLAMVAQQAERDEEGLDVVIVAVDAALALLTPLPKGLHLVGVVAERELAFAPAGSERIAVIAGVYGARESIEEGNLLILDPERGRVLIEPEAEEFAQLQGESNRRSRMLLGAAHTPAHTQSGHAVSVFAAIQTPEDLETAVTCGADGLFLAAGTPLLPAEDDASALSGLLLAADTIGGGAVTVYATPDTLDTRHLLLVATRCRLQWAYPARSVDVSIRDMRIELARQAEDEMADGRQTLVPTIVLGVSSLAEAEGLPTDQLLDTEEILVEAEDGKPLLEPNSALSLPPVRLVLGDYLDQIPNVVVAGVRGIVVSPSLIATAKDIIREQE